MDSTLGDTGRAILPMIMGALKNVTITEHTMTEMHNWMQTIILFFSLFNSVLLEHVVISTRYRLTTNYFKICP